MASNENKIQKTLAASIIVLTTVLGTGCGDNDDGLDAERLYNDNCATCHGFENQGRTAGIIDARTPKAIKLAIANVPDMQRTDLQALTDAEILAISDHLFFPATIP